MSHEALKKRVERLEEEKGVDATDFVLWSGSDGGIFGHVHVIGMQNKTPCSDEEEVEIMRSQFERDKRRIWGKGQEVPFWQYLEAYDYLAPPGLAERQRVAIDKLKGS